MGLNIGCLIGVCWGRMNKGVVHFLFAISCSENNDRVHVQFKGENGNEMLVTVHGKSGCSFPVQLLANLLADILTN